MYTNIFAPHQFISMRTIHDGQKQTVEVFMHVQG